MPHYLCPLCSYTFSEKEHVGEHFKEIHPVEWESIQMIRKIIALFNRIGWPS